MGRESKQAFYQRSTDGQQTYAKMIVSWEMQTKKTTVNFHYYQKVKKH